MGENDRTLDLRNGQVARPRKTLGYRRPLESARMCWFSDERLWEISCPFVFTPERFEEATGEVVQIGRRYTHADV